MNVFITGTTGFVGARLVNSIQDKIKILSRKKYFPRRQCLQIEMSVNTYNNIIEKLK